MEVWTTADLIREGTEHQQRLIEHPVWGKWTLNRDTFCLVYEGDNADWYEIDLDTFTDSAQILDWIFQVARKPWIPAQGIGDLLKAINQIFRPQKNYCSWGKDHKGDPRQIAGWILGEPD